MSDLTDILADPDFRTGNPVWGYAVTRRAAPTVADGIATDGATSSLTTGPAILRPLSGSDLQALPEGYHVADLRKILTTADLRDGKSGTPADIVTIDGEALDPQHLAVLEPGGEPDLERMTQAVEASEPQAVASKPVSPSDGLPVSWIWLGVAAIVAVMIGVGYSRRASHPPVFAESAPQTHAAAEFQARLGALDLNLDAPSGTTSSIGGQP